MGIALEGSKSVNMGYTIDRSEVKILPKEKLRRRIGRVFYKQYPLQRDLNIARHLLQGNLQDPEQRQIAKSFYSQRLKQYERLPVTSSESQGVITDFARRVLAARIGLPHQVFDEGVNPGFYDFISRNFIFKKIEFFKERLPEHQISLDSQGQAHLLFDGKKLPWQEVRSQLEINSKGAIVNAYYNYRGICLTPDWKRLDAEKPIEDFTENDVEEFIRTRAIVFDHPPQSLHQKGKWVVTIKGEAINDRYRLRGDHFWLRLKTPDGRIISMGLYRDQAVCATQGGYMTMVDPSEFYMGGGAWKETDIEVSQQQWLYILKILVTETKTPAPYYAIAQGNCVTYIRNLLAHTGMRLNTFAHAFNHISPSIIAKVKERSLLHRIISIFSNTIMYVIGCSKVKKSLSPWSFQAYGYNGKPLSQAHREAHYRKISDVFDKNRAFLDSPHKLRLEQLEIEEYRKKTVEEVNRKYSTKIAACQDDGQRLLLLKQKNMELAAAHYALPASKK
ncbi:MAG: hypothetical protein ACQEP8_06490 [Chlamydiota bacterium]